MLLVFWMVFSAPVISRIESIWGGWDGGKVGDGGRWGANRLIKAPIQTQKAVLYLQYGTQTDAIHKGGQYCRKEQFCTPCNPIKALQGHEMHPRCLTASVKSHLYKQTWPSTHDQVFW